MISARRLPRLLRAVERGESILITRHGKRVARLMPVETGVRDDFEQLNAPGAAPAAARHAPERAAHGAARRPRAALHPFDEALAFETGVLRAGTGGRGLSLGAMSSGSRACLALARRLGARVLPPDRAWQGLDLDVPVALLRWKPARASGEPAPPRAGRVRRRSGRRPPVNLTTTIFG